MSQEPRFSSGTGLPTAVPPRGPGLPSDSGPMRSAPHAPSQSRVRERSERPLQPAPARRQNPLRRSLLQKYWASLVVEPDKEVMLPVLVVDANLKQQALLARVSQNYEPSLVTASAVRDLGFEPLSLPPGVLKPFICPLGRINPVRYVGLVVEQGRNNLSPTIVGNVIVLDDKFNDRGPDLYLGRRFLQDAFDGNLPPKVSNTVGGAGERRNAPNPISHAQIGNNNPPVWTSPTPMRTTAQQALGETQFPWPGHSLSYAQPSGGVQVANQTSVFPAPQMPMPGDTSALLYAPTSSNYPFWSTQSTQPPEADVPGDQGMPPWNTGDVSTQSPFAPQPYDPNFGTNGDDWEG